MERHARTRRQRVPRWLAIPGGILALCALVWLSPLQGVAQQAILLGPDSLFPPPVTHSLVLQRAGHRVTVAVPSGLVREGLSFRSAALGGRLETYSIYLPPGYNTPSDSERRYPVLYLLHGAPGQPGDWIHGMHVQVLEDQGIAAGTLKPMIIVMPEGNGGVWQDSQYVNTLGGFRAEDLIAHDVVHYIDAHYRTIADRRARAIAGISEGAYGAMNLGLKHHDVFGTIVSISGYFSADPAEVLIGNDPWGHDSALMKANSPLLYVRQLSGLRDTAILIMDNSSDGGYTVAARRFDQALTAAHIPHQLLLQPAPNPLAAHYWPYWRQAFPVALAFISRHLSS
ncbi:MAG TPA: alpha/beta hydrolase-fold protein [Chloroflexota bacterium]|nr:alpha/beta hydrolase-fold protein [Chloroflexota bacterium]